MRACAYCNAVGIKRTKEHLWPTSLHRRIDEANRVYFGKENLFYLDKICNSLSGEPQIKDVCANCNNAVLSKLDTYICHLWDTYFGRIVETGEHVLFSYDYSSLSRWLLKLCYNSARIHNSDVEHLRKCRDYILGQGTHPDNVLIHLQLANPSDYSIDGLAVAKEIGLNATRHEPRLNRVGHFGYMTRSDVGRLVRAVHLQSFLFLIHLFPEKVATTQRQMDLEDFKLAMPYAGVLCRDKTYCTVVCKGLDSKESFYSHYGSKQML